LSSNHVVIDCGQRKIVFPDTVGLELISSNQAVREIEAGATCYMIVAQAEKMSTTEKISRIPVVDEYPDVFPDEIPELPPSRDVDFSITSAGRPFGSGYFSYFAPVPGPRHIGARPKEDSLWPRLYTEAIESLFCLGC